jgi:hypothetical protein
MKHVSGDSEMHSIFSLKIGKVSHELKDNITKEFINVECE